MDEILSIHDLEKTYAGGLQALKTVSLDIRRGEIFALLGPNGAGKTTLINAVCGLINPTGGQITVDGYDILRDYRRTRALIGLVPQELCTDAFETVWDTVNFSRGVFGLRRDPAFVERTLKQLALWDKRNNMIRTLSGGMKRRVMIAKALAHEPKVLFLDEPTAGVDVSLRKGMWEQVRQLQKTGVTIILTTHYIEEAELMAERIGVINHGKIIVTEEKHALMKKLGSKQLLLDLSGPLSALPPQLARWPLTLNEDRTQLVYTYDSAKDDNGIAELLAGLSAAEVHYKDIHTKQRSLEEIFLELVK